MGLTQGELVLHHDPTSEPSRAVHWFALEAGIDVVLKHVWLARDEHLQEGFLRINPWHQVPALVDGDFVLTEATAIIQYLAEHAGASDRWLGATARSRARCAMLLSWYQSNLRPAGVLNYFLPVLLRPAYDGAPPPTAFQIAPLASELRRVLDQVDAWLEVDPFLGGHQLSVADIMFAADLSAFDCDPARAKLFAGFGNIERWLRCLNSRSAHEKSHRPWAKVALEMSARLSGDDLSTDDRRWVADCAQSVGYGAPNIG